MYKKLRIISYESYQNYEQEYQKRLSSDSTIMTNLNIYPFSPQQEVRIGDNYPIICVLLPEILILVEKVLSLSKNIEQLSATLPPAAINKLIFSQAVNEIKSTNDIEGVRSTKQEISSALNSDNQTENLRFESIAKMYTSVINQETKYINQLLDFRNIYDNLFSGEIEKNDLPDGDLFRKRSVYIHEGDKKIHSGNPTEESINGDLNQLILFMNQDHFSFLLKAIITHYFFEYIHPFYDGNGRMGRFLMSSYLTRKLDVFSGISISEAIFNNKKEYEDAFMEVSHPKNKGDVTHFVLSILTIIISGQKKMYENISILKKQLDNAHHYLEEQNYSEEESSILFVYYQNYLFDLNDELLSNVEMEQYSELSRYKIDNITKALEEKEALIKVKSNPIVYKLGDKLLEIVE